MGGPAKSAQMKPEWVAVDANGKLYFTDAENYRVRKIANNVVTTIAGTGYQGYGVASGSAAQAAIGITNAIVVDSNLNVYFADVTNAVVLEIGAASGSISVFAGSGQTGYINDGIPATQELMVPTGLVFDKAGDLFISDVNLNRVIKVDTNLNASTVAGGQGVGFAGDGGLAINAELSFPNGLAVDSSGGLYIADQFNQRVRKVVNQQINTFAGTFIRDGGPATMAFLAFPDGVAVSGSNPDRGIGQRQPGGGGLSRVEELSANSASLKARRRD